MREGSITDAEPWLGPGLGGAVGLVVSPAEVDVPGTNSEYQSIY